MAMDGIVANMVGIGIGNDDIGNVKAVIEEGKCTVEVIEWINEL
jgi:hypothetical protein